MIREDIYPVGILEAIKHHRIKAELRFLRDRLRERNWRAIRNAFNGYLAEHDGCPHNAGKGWTRRAASRRVNRLCFRIHES